jgi:hypothetical protein
MTRVRLPDRRAAETVELEHGGQRFTVTIGFYPDGRPGEVFADLHRRHHMAMGLPLPSPPSVASILINEGIFGSSPSEPMLEALERLKGRFEEATDALDQCDREHALAAGRRPTLLVYRAVCADEDTTGWSHEDLGNLRMALNALVRIFRL